MLYFYYLMQSVVDASFMTDLRLFVFDRRLCDLAQVLYVAVPHERLACNLPCRIAADVAASVGLVLAVDADVLERGLLVGVFDEELGLLLAVAAAVVSVEERLGLAEKVNGVLRQLSRVIFHLLARLFLW